MWQRLLGWLTPLVLLAALALPAIAQNPDFKDTRWKDDSGVPSLPGSKERVPVMEYLLAFCGSLLVLLIVCTPSRRRLSRLTSGRHAVGCTGRIRFWEPPASRT